MSKKQLKSVVLLMVAGLVVAFFLPVRRELIPTYRIRVVIVQPGDTFIGIVRAHNSEGATREATAACNPDSQFGSDFIRSGQRIILCGLEDGRRATDIARK